MAKKTGRPLFYKTPEELQEKIDDYFSLQDLSQTSDSAVSYPYTLSGLAAYLGFADRQSCYDYEYKPEFACTIKRAKLKITEQWERRLVGPNAAGPIFMLKNLGFSDAQKIEYTGKDEGPVKFEFVSPPKKPDADTD